ncbi:CAP domain-containing protein [Blastococcus sp. CT_GayMR16]|nr:CAP domain-containing protein [Blastococcus sp. CT_GayMR16]
MGRDGRAVSSSTFAGLSTSPASARGSSTDAFAAPPTVAPGAGSAPAPAPVETPAPAEAAPAPEATTEAAAPPPVVEEAPEPPAPAAAAVPADLGAEDQVLALVNVQRAAAGCGALTGDASLASVARAHSADMRDRGFFDHVNLDGLDPFDRAERAGITARAENIAYGQQDAAEVMVSWMNSAGHRANILNCNLTRLGVGMADGSGGPWWTQLFA